MKNYLNGNYQPENSVKRVDQEPIKWLRSKDVRKMLGISDSTLQTMRINGSIPSYKLGSSWFYREDEIVTTLEAGRTSRKEVMNG